MHLEPVNQKLLQQLKPEEVEVDIVRAEVIEKLEERGVKESELDEMWSYVGKKANPRWLWHAIDRRTGQVKRICVWTAKRSSVYSTQAVAHTIWYPKILHRWKVSL